MRAWLKQLQTELENGAANEAQTKINPDTYFADCLETLSKMLHSPHSERVWKTLERRLDSNAKTLMELASEGYRPPLQSVQSTCPLTKFCMINEARHSQESKPKAPDLMMRNIGDMSKDLIGTVTLLRQMQVSMDTVGKRRKQLKAVENAAETLRRALFPLWSGLEERVEIGRTFDISSPLNQLVDRTIGAWLNDIAKGEWSRVDASAIDIARHAGRQIVRAPFDLLDALVCDTRHWAEEHIDIPRPKDTNALRLLFIRKLTYYFRLTYDEPLRDCVLAVTSIFFDCESLDDAAVAKLAP